MKIVNWILQIVLAAFFIMHGWIFVAPPPEMVEVMNASFPVALRYFIGVAELLAAAGLILPNLTRIQPWLIPFSAAGLALIVACATVLHSMRGETSSALTTAVLCVVAIAVAYMRWRVVPVQPRTLAYSTAE